MLSLPQVSLIALTNRDFEGHKQMLDRSSRLIKFGGSKIIWDETCNSLDMWSYKVLYELWKYVDTDFALIFQADSCVTEPMLWRDEFLEYDYIGAPWPSKTHYVGDQEIRVGNGGFSLRSKKLLKAFVDLNLPFTDNQTGFYNEDGNICVYHRKTLEDYGIKYAPVEVAARFSSELTVPETVESFGKHKYL